jgi:hypothetical protein
MNLEDINASVLAGLDPEVAKAMSKASENIQMWQTFGYITFVIAFAVVVIMVSYKDCK